MAQYHGIAQGRREEGPLEKIEHQVHWALVHWRLLLAGVVALLAVSGGVVWYQHAQATHVRAAAAAYAAAIDVAEDASPDAEALSTIVAKFAQTPFADLARFQLARLAMTDEDFTKVREVLTPLTTRGDVLPFLRAQAYHWLASSFEREEQWHEAAQSYQHIFAFMGPGIDYAGALRNAVRTLVHAGDREAATTLLSMKPPANADPQAFTTVQQEETLWLAIAPAQ
jgi:hypothetical protein